jgi:hypothetical protein
MPPIDAILSRYGLELRELPIAWIGAHGLK